MDGSRASWQAFETVDSDKSGYLSIEEVGQAWGYLYAWGYIGESVMASVVKGRVLSVRIFLFSSESSLPR